MEIIILLRNINDNFLSNDDAGIRIEITEFPMTMNYEQDLATFRSDVNNNFLPNMGNQRQARQGK